MALRVGYKLVELSTGEITALVSWHLDQEIESANKREYEQAAWHSRRGAELTKIMSHITEPQVKAP